MRDKEKKHRKGQESTIGKIIYGFLLFMPLIAIGATCLYTIFNKNAYLSYSDSQVENEKTIITGTTFVTDQTYIIEYTNNDSTSSQEIRFKYSTYDFAEKANVAQVDAVTIYATGTIYTYFWNGTTYVNNASIQNIWGTELKSFQIVYNSKTTNQIVNGNGKLQVKQLILETNKLDNNFYYAIDKVTESPLFNWAENSIIYTTTNSTCNALSITTPFIPLLLSYWLIISVIYFLYDIALMLVWLIHRKIHELQESL